MKTTIKMPARILDRHVGGNTTYARELASRLSHRGFQIERIPQGANPLSTLLHETFAGLRTGKADNEILHYVADTGPIFRTKVPSVITVHGVASRWISTARTPLQESIWRSRVSRAIASCDEIITVSKSSANDISEIFNVSQERITTIHHGIDIKKFRNTPISNENITQKLPNEFVLYLGNIEPRKNIIALIDAFQSPELRALNIPLIIAGKPAWNFDEIMSRIQDAENVIYLGFVSDSDRLALLRKCKLFVFPSLYEGFGFPVLEAMAAGALVLTSNTGSLAEVAGPALRFQDTTSEAIIEGILNSSLTADESEEYQKQAGKWLDQFSWDNSVSAHISVYNKVMS